jgi:hypothetical protein
MLSSPTGAGGFDALDKRASSTLAVPQGGTRIGQTARADGERVAVSDTRTGVAAGRRSRVVAHDLAGGGD